jgi:hypothetical protein
MTRKSWERLGAGQNSFSGRAAHLALALVILIAAESQLLLAAELRVITPEMIAAVSPYNLHQPVITVSAISGDGSTIAGFYQESGVVYDCARSSCGIGPFLWSLNADSSRRHITNPTPLDYGTHVDNAVPLLVTALSHDGRAALVVSENGHYEAAIYREDKPQRLRPRIIPNEQLLAADMSSDGGVVVGNLGLNPFRWDAASGLREISGLPSNTSFMATALSGDGRVAVLNAQPIHSTGSPSANGYTWTEAVLSELPQAPGDNYSQAVAASYDGRSVVGTSVLRRTNSTVGRAVRWDDGSLTLLDALREHPWSSALDVSANGEFIVGRAFREPTTLHSSTVSSPIYQIYNTAVPSRAVLWDAQGKVFDLQNLLATQFELGARLEGWQLTSAAHISDDGRTIAGMGIDPNGNGAIWVAVLPVPEPESIALFVSGAAILLPMVGRQIRQSRR